MARGLTNVPINAPVEGLKRSTERLTRSATYKFPSGPMVSPCPETVPPLPKVSLYAPVYWLYDFASVVGRVPPLLMKMSARNAGSHAPAESIASTAGNARKVLRVGKCDLYIVVSYEIRHAGRAPQKFRIEIFERYSLLTVPLPTFATQTWTPSKATPKGAYPTPNVPRVAPSLARNSVTLLL